MTGQTHLHTPRYGLTPAIAERLKASCHRIVITGASGWIGMATLEMLAAALGGDLQQRVHCYGSQPRTLELRDGLAIQQRPLGEIACLPDVPTLVLHTAFLTKDKVSQIDDGAYRAANANLTALVLNSLDTIGAVGVFVASSGAARSAGDPAAAHAQRLYGEAKAHEETVFSNWARRTGGTAVVSRIFNITGPYINKHDRYAIAGLILDALARRPIIVQAPHEVVRGYVAIRELMSLIFALLLDEEKAVTAFDTGGSRWNWLRSPRWFQMCLVHYRSSAPH